METNAEERVIGTGSDAGEIPQSLREAMESNSLSLEQLPVKRSVDVSSNNLHVDASEERVITVRS